MSTEQTTIFSNHPVRIGPVVQRYEDFSRRQNPGGESCDMPQILEDIVADLMLFAKDRDLSFDELQLRAQLRVNRVLQYAPNAPQQRS